MNAEGFECFKETTSYMQNRLHFSFCFDSSIFSIIDSIQIYKSPEVIASASDAVADEIRVPGGVQVSDRGVYVLKSVSPYHHTPCGLERDFHEKLKGSLEVCGCVQGSCKNCQV